MWVLFYIIQNTQTTNEQRGSIELTEVVEAEAANLLTELYPRVKVWSVTKANLKKWLEKWGEEKIKETIRAVELQINAGKEVTNPGGLFYHLLQQPTLFDATKNKRTEAKAKKAAAAARLLKKQNLESELRNLESEKHRKEVAIIEAILIEMPEVQQLAIEKIKTGMFAVYWNEGKTVIENLENQVCLSAFRNAIKKEFASRFERLQNSYQPKIEALKLQLAKV